jgi:hypothetical protein
VYLKEVCTLLNAFDLESKKACVDSEDSIEPKALCVCIGIQAKGAMRMHTVRIRAKVLCVCIRLAKGAIFRLYAMRATL